MPADDDLLARLNALKKSSVSLDTNYNASIAPTVTDDLAARFARLGSASPYASPQPSRTASSNAMSTPFAAPRAPTYLEGVAEGVGRSNVDFNDEDERSLEELLGELKETVGDKSEWDLSHKEQQDVGRLLKDMKKILPEVVNSRAQDRKSGNQGAQQAPQEGLTDWESIEVNVGDGVVAAGKNDLEHDNGSEGEGKKPTEDEEADDVIARFMAELEISRKYDPPSPPPRYEEIDRQDERSSKTRAAPQASSGLELPSAPNDVPEDDFERTKAFEDAFTARLAALSAPSPSRTDSLGMPTAPSFSPRKKPPVASNLQRRLDDEIDTWCCICQDDATLKCLGCDDDLYCQRCWNEGHRGESAGFEERNHKAVLYARKKKQAAA